MIFLNIDGSWVPWFRVRGFGLGLYGSGRRPRDKFGHFRKLELVAGALNPEP